MTASSTYTTWPGDVMLRTWQDKTRPNSGNPPTIEDDKPMGGMSPER